MDPLFAFSTSAILIMGAVFAWFRLMTIDNGVQDQRARIELWFVSAAVITTFAVIWTILSLMNIEKSENQVALLTQTETAIAQATLVARTWDKV